MFFQSTLLGARCRQTSTRAGHALVRILQSILAQFVDSWVSFDEINDGCMHYLDHLAPAGEICVVSGQCALEYMNWFFVISHPFMIAAQPLDPPRDAPATHDASFVEPHIPQVPKPVAASTHARSDVE